MRLLYLLFGLFILVTPLSAQNLHIYYDVAKDSITYIKNGKIIEKPRLKKGNQAILHIQNFNDYVYDLDVKTNSSNYKINSGSSGLLNFGGSSNNLDDLTGFAEKFVINGNFELSDNPLISDRSGAGEGRQVTEAERQIAAQFESKIITLFRLEEKLERLSNQISRASKAIEQKEQLKQKLQLLKYHPTLAPSRIKEISEKELDVLEDASRRDALSNIDQIQELLLDYSASVNDLDKNFTELDLINRELSKFDLTVDEKITFQSSYIEAGKKVSSYKSRVQKINNNITALQKTDDGEIMNLSLEYEELKSHQFEKKIVLNPEDDLNTIKIRLVPMDSANVAGARTKDLNPLQLSVFGGLKINASVGISFAALFDTPESYFTRDNIVMAEDLDPFTPIVTSFIHFHPQSKGQASLGGAFGIGIGLGGESAGLQNYFLGPSLILGKSQRIIFTSGLNTSKVTRLAEGLQPGDLYEESILPTKSVFELGYFLGVSFNLAGQ